MSSANYKGLHGQIAGNNRKSILYLIAFPLLILAAVYVFLVFTTDPIETNEIFIQSIPFTILITGIWFLMAYFMHSTIINYASGSHSVERKDEMRIYNLTENLCISQGMKMPKLRVIEDRGLNAFASGINEKTYTVTLTRGIINTLNDQELEGVIAHELMHIKNKDVKLLIISIVFVGIFSFLVQVLFRSLLYGGGRRRNNKDSGKLVLVALVVSLIAYFLSMIFKFGLSRKREYMADAGAAEMTRNPRALASALRKISGNSAVEAVKGEDIKEMFIENHPEDSKGFMSALSGLFATHPPIEKRIAFLEQV
jgi:heat shock protein HtpX